MNAFIHLEQAHVNYLDALGRSSFSPDKQHAMYSTFQEAMKKAGADRCFLNTFDVNYSGKSTTLVEAATRNATQSQQLVQKLLKDIQNPHPELRNNVAQNLRYRDVQWHQTASKNSSEALQLKSEMSVIRSFEAAGGLSSLSQPEAEKLNGLFSVASKAYNEWQKKDAAYKSGATKSSEPLHEAEQKFKTADAAVISEISRLERKHNALLELKKTLVHTLRHKEALLANSANATGQLGNEIKTLKVFLNSRELAALDSKTADSLTHLFQIAEQKYGEWQKLANDARAAEAKVSTATDEPSSPQPEDNEELPLTAQEKANQAEWDANDAKEAFSNADAAVMNQIKIILYPPPLLPLPPVSTLSFSERLGPPRVTVNLDTGRTAPFTSKGLAAEV